MNNFETQSQEDIAAKSIAKAVSRHLVNLAIDDALPSDMNDLDVNLLAEVIKKAHNFGGTMPDNVRLAIEKLKTAYNMLEEWGYEVVRNPEDSPTLGDANAVYEEAMRLLEE